MTGRNPYSTPFSETRNYPESEGTPVPSIPLDMRSGSRLLPQSQQVLPQRFLDSLKYGSFINVPLSIGVVSQLVLIKPPSRRIFLQIQNTHAIQQMFVVFGTPATLITGIRLGPNGTATYDSVVPQDDIHIIASGGATTGVLIYCNKSDSEY